MKKLFLFALPLLLVSCKSVEEYRAGIEELATNWDNTTKAVTDFSGMVSSDLTTYTKAYGDMKMDEMAAKKLKPEQTTALAAAQKSVEDALGAYGPFQQTINDFVKTWSEKSADVTALKDGLNAGKLEMDVPGKLTELNALVASAGDNLKTWQASYGGLKGGVDTAMSALSQLMATLAPAPAKK